MKNLHIGDYIRPTYIDDEFLAQYTGLPCKVLKISKVNGDTVINVQHEHCDSFDIICPPDLFEVIERRK